MKNLKTFDDFVNENYSVDEALSSKEKKIIDTESDWDGNILSRWYDEYDTDEVTASHVKSLILLVGADTDEFEELYDKANSKKKSEIEKYFADKANSDN